MLAEVHQVALTPDGRRVSASTGSATRWSPADHRQSTPTDGASAHATKSCDRRQPQSCPPWQRRCRTSSMNGFTVRWRCKGPMWDSSTARVQTAVNTEPYTHGKLLATLHTAYPCPGARGRLDIPGIRVHYQAHQAAQTLTGHHRVRSSTTICYTGCPSMAAESHRCCRSYASLRQTQAAKW